MELVVMRYIVQMMATLLKVLPMNLVLNTLVHINLTM